MPIKELVKIEITKPLPETGTVGVTYTIEGTVKMFDAVGALPWVYAEVRRKEWWKPEIIEEISYERGFPMPVTGSFSIDIKPEKVSDYEVTVIATPAPLSLPVVGVFPVVGKSDTVKIRVAEEIATDIKNIEISVLGPAFPATDLKNIAIGVIGPEFPATDLKNIAIGVIGPEVPPTDIKNIAIIVRGPAYPATDIKNITIKLIEVAFPSTDIKNIKCTVKAVAPPPVTYHLSVYTSPGGYIEPGSGDYLMGRVVTLTAYPLSGYKFTVWGGDASGTSPICSLTMDSNKSVWAYFEPMPA